MARTSKSRGASTFKLRSQGGTFKMMGATTPLYKNKIVHGEGKDWQHDHKSKPAHPNTPEAHNVKTSPMGKKKNWQADYKEGLDSIKLAIKNNPGMSRHEIRKLVLKHNQSIKGTKYKGGESWMKARIGLNDVLGGSGSRSKEETTTPTTTGKKQAFTEAKKEIKVEEMYHGAGGKIMNPDGSVNIEATKANTEHFGN